MYHEMVPCTGMTISLDLVVRIEHIIVFWNGDDQG